MSNEIEDYLSEDIKWKRTANARFPYAANYKGENLTIRVNNFPDEALYTLIAGDGRELDFEDWSAHWKRPASTSQPALRTAEFSG